MPLTAALAGALCAALLAASPERPRFAWPVPDRMETVEVPETLVAQGVPVRIKMVRVHHSLKEMLDLYYASFERAGFYVPPDKEQLQLFSDPTLTALDTQARIAYSVTFQDNHDGTTTLVLGEANLALRGLPERGKSLPVFPGARSLLKTDGEGAQTLTYVVTAPPREVLAFHRETLGKGGYTLESGDEEAAVYRGGEEELSVSARPNSHGDTVVILVSRLRPRGG